MKRQTGHIWLTYLPLDIRYKLLANLERFGYLSRLNNEFHSLSNFISSSFGWAGTLEGSTYWADLADTCDTIYTVKISDELFPIY